MCSTPAAAVPGFESASSGDVRPAHRARRPGGGSRLLGDRRMRRRQSTGPGFVRRDGLGCCAAQPYRIVGANMWYAAWLGADAPFGDRARLGRELDGSKARAQQPENHGRGRGRAR
jgi:hypothetical protein